MDKPFLRDGVDVYLEEVSETLYEVVFVFLSTRKRIRVRAESDLVSLLPLLDGENELSTVCYKSNCDLAKAQRFVDYLKVRGVVIERSWLEQLAFDARYVSRLEKQLYFMLDVVNSTEQVELIQKRIKNSKVAIWGMGAVGSWYLVEMIKMGFQSFRIFDYKSMSNDSVCRHAFPSDSAIGVAKVDYYSSLAKSLDQDVNVQVHSDALATDRSVLNYLDDVDIIVNCADEPYIGYTSIFLSRYALSLGKILVVAGGFDAHLGCLGEVIVPYKTPCADCYNTHFKHSLKDWKPVAHPVKERARAFGGLAQLSAFSASAGCLAILRLLMDEASFLEGAGGRGEFKFDDYSIDSFVVQKNDNCGVCGNG